MFIIDSTFCIRVFYIFNFEHALLIIEEYTIQYYQELFY